MLIRLIDSLLWVFLWKWLRTLYWKARFILSFIIVNLQYSTPMTILRRETVSHLSNLLFAIVSHALIKIYCNYSIAQGAPLRSSDVETKTRARLILIQASINHRDTIMLTSVTSLLASRYSGATAISLRAITAASRASCLSHDVSRCPSPFRSRIRSRCTRCISSRIVTNTLDDIRWLTITKTIYIDG